MTLTKKQQVDLAKAVARAQGAAGGELADQPHKAKLLENDILN